MKPILFNTEMVRAILDGRKTVTRRVVGSINPRACCQVEDDYSHEFIRDDFADRKFTGFICRKCGYGVSPPHGRTSVGTSFIKPPYQPSDILWVRETFSTYRQNGQDFYIYKVYDRNKKLLEEVKNAQITWRPSIHMPREAARIFLWVTDVRVERLQDITMIDMAAEGVIPKIVTGGQWQQWQEDYMRPAWDSTVKPKDRGLYGWDANPWVWVISFERIGRGEVSDDV